MISICDCNGGVLTSKDGDIKITIPEGAIMNGEVVKFYIAVSLYGPFVLPCQANLVSPYYWIGVNRSYHFQKPINVKFEHFAVVTDPLHYSLLTCEDNDELYSMQPVDYDLDFTVQDDISLCSFQTSHFCSYCLFCNANQIPINKISVLYLRQKHMQHSNPYTVEIWFTLAGTMCKNRYEKLYKRKDMMLDESYVYFDVSCDKNSASYFTLDYNENIVGWLIRHNLPKRIDTKRINFFNYYKNSEELLAHEECSLFPPRFVLKIVKDLECNKHLVTAVEVTLYNTEDMKTPSCPYNLFVPVPVQENNSTNVPLVIQHNCNNNEPELRDLLKYSPKLFKHWEEVALYLGIPIESINEININHQNDVRRKCLAMFETWRQRATSLCWCHFIQALHDVGLHNVALEAQVHLSPVTDEQHLEANIHVLNNYILSIKNKRCLRLFILALLPADCAIKIIVFIETKGKSKIENAAMICDRLLQEGDPKWSTVCFALEAADCDDLSNDIKVNILKDGKF